MTLRFDDLEDLARGIYERAGELVEGATTENGQAKALELRLKAVRTMAELRERSREPEQIRQLELKLDQVERTIKEHYRDSNTVVAAPEPDRTGEPPDWRV